MLGTPPRAVAVLDGAVTYAHTALERARRCALDLPTPCVGWDLGDLLRHMEDSLEAIGEAAELGYVAVVDHPERHGSDRLVDRIVQRACSTRAAWAGRLTSAPVGVEDLVLGRDTMVLVGALEIAVHGWDVARATGAHDPLPEHLAVRLLDVALAVVTPTERGRRFADPLVVPPGAAAGTRLLAHLGRRQG